MTKSVIFHVDANSAFLSWTAAYRVKVLGDKLDLRKIPSVIAGEKSSRHSIVLARSTPAKSFGIQTGEPLFLALEKCPYLAVAEPDFSLYVESSRHMIAVLREYSQKVEQYSVDEAWVDMTGTQRLFGTPVQAANTIRERIRRELGFTVNVGISTNKLLAKMAGDLKKPDLVHTLYPEEIPEKLWPLPVRELFMVGASTEQKLRMMGILTIGDLARADVGVLRSRLGKAGEQLWHSANGRNMDAVIQKPVENKGYGNSVTLPSNVTDSRLGHMVLQSLCETVAMRMRRDGKYARCITVHLRSGDFTDSSHQGRLHGNTDSTREICEYACRLFDEAWDGVTPLRKIGVQVTDLSQEHYRQYDLFDRVEPRKYQRQLRLDAAIDGLREKYGEDIIRRARFTSGSQPHMAGGLGKDRRTGITKQV